MDSIFAGSGAPLDTILRWLEKEGIANVRAVFAPTDDKIINDYCRRRSIPLENIETLSKGCGSLSIYPCDWFFSVYSTHIYHRDVIRYPKRGALNMHPGRLPDYAGLFVNQWAIRNGETEFESTLHWMVSEVDQGPVAYVEKFTVDPEETGISLFLNTIDAGVMLVKRAIKDIHLGKALPRIEQDLTRRKVYSKKEAMLSVIDWTQSAVQIERFIRAADYERYPSPTYQPFIECDGKQYPIKSAKLLNEKSNLAPASIIKRGEGYFEVVAGDQYLLHLGGECL